LDRIFTNPTDIIGKFDDIQITIIALFFIIVASASTNLVANFIPSQYSLINFSPKNLTLKSASYTISAIGFFIGIFWLTVLKSNWNFIIRGYTRFFFWTYIWFNDC
jgi:NCS1 family nucleobase:cation symporter-1